MKQLICFTFALLTLFAKLKGLEPEDFEGTPTPLLTFSKKIPIEMDFENSDIFKFRFINLK
jgi:hypothetical protein